VELALDLTLVELPLGELLGRGAQEVHELVVHVPGLLGQRPAREQADPRLGEVGRPPLPWGRRPRSSAMRRTVSESTSGGRTTSRSASAAQVSPASRNSTPISVSSAPWNTGVFASKPRIVAAQPRWVSRI